MEKTYLIFRANCVRNPNMTGDFEFYNKYHYPTANRIIPYDRDHPALKFESIVVTDRKLNPRNQCKDGISGTETVLMISKNVDGDYEITVTFHDKTINTSRSEDRWNTDDFDISSEFVGLSQKEISAISKRLIEFYNEYFDLKQKRQLSIEYLSNKYLVEIW